MFQLAFNRTSEGNLPIYDRQFIASDGANLNGFTDDEPGTIVTGVNFRVESFLPFDLLLDGAIANNGKKLKNDRADFPNT